MGLGESLVKIRSSRSSGWDQTSSLDGGFLAGLAEVSWEKEV